jgi:mercuric ion binding protein
MLKDSGMKRISNLLLLLAMLTTAAFANNAGTATITIKTQIYCDHCLQCGSCGANINDQVREHNKGIKKVKVDAKSNTITVQYDAAKTNAEQIRDAIANAGYDADDKKANPDAVAKLDGCCKK